MTMKNEFIIHLKVLLLLFMMNVLMVVVVVNYKSIVQEGVVEKMNNLIYQELENGALTIVEDKPFFVHALGAVMKPDLDVRPITDCGHPSGLCLNDHMEEMSLNIDTVVEVLERGNYMYVITIKSAYRSVAINPNHSKYQGIRSGC